MTCKNHLQQHPDKPVSFFDIVVILQNESTSFNYSKNCFQNKFNPRAGKHRCGLFAYGDLKILGNCATDKLLYDLRNEFIEQAKKDIKKSVNVLLATKCGFA